MIKITQLSFQYPQSDQLVLNNVNLEILPGTLNLITGASGSGKSTLLRCINGLVPHFSGGTISGEISVFGSDPIMDGPEVMSTKVGFVFQEPEAQFVFDVVEDEIAFTLENAGVPREELQTRVNEMIYQMQLTRIRKKNVQEISGGEMQKVAIASALVSRPQVLILDEPTSQLDPLSANEVLNFIVSLKKLLGLTILISEHRLERLLPYADAIIHLTPEQKILTGSPSKILPLMAQAPPIVRIAKKLEITPMPFTPEQFHQSMKSRQTIFDNEYSEISHSEGPVVLSLDHISASIGEEQILHQVSLNLRHGEILSLLGPNGAGKTTLLRAILGLIPSSGKKLLFDQDMAQLNLANLIQHIGYLPQNPNDLLFAESVLEELIITLNNHHIQLHDSDIAAFLAKLGLEDKQDQYPRDLSVGERQRTALAAISVHQPQIMLVDEPTRGLDYFAKQRLSDLFRFWRDKGQSILLVTHDVEFAAGIANRVAILENGKITFTGNPRIAFTQFPIYRTQTSQLFPTTHWITPEDVKITPDSQA